jgi:desulfoferrodoxin (superoxide reductase-like protein)
MSNAKDPRMLRRDVVKLVPLAFMGTMFAGVARVLTACTQATSTDDRRGGLAGPSTPQGGPDPTDDDEFVDGTNAPAVNAGDLPPQVPNNAWESRAKQLDAQQLLEYGIAVFTTTAPGIWAGKERSHVPKAVVTTENNLKKVTVVVEHVMGKNLLDAGAAPPVDAARPDTGGGGIDAGRDASDAGTDGAAVKPKPEHYITTIYVRALVGGKDTVVGLYEFNAGDAAPPSVKFTLPEGVTEVIAWEWCTLHGLWKADPITV